jgi:RimJ/RimL family protein N-acetyltransferase
MAETDRQRPRSGVYLRDVEDGDLDLFYRHQRDPVAVRMAQFPSRERAEFMAHWAKIRADPANDLRTVVADGVVVGNLMSWDQAEGEREVGYWIGREFWGRGIATAALALFLDKLTVRPLHAYVVVDNIGSIRVLEKCGFRRVSTQVSPKDGIEEVVLILPADPA